MEGVQQSMRDMNIGGQHYNQQMDEALQQERRFSVNSMVQLDPSFTSPNAFGITFDGTATYGLPPFPASEHPLPPPPPPYMEASPMTSTSGQVLTPVMVFTPLPLPFGAHPYPGFGGAFSPPPLGSFAYSPPSLHQQAQAHSQAQYSTAQSAPVEYHQPQYSQAMPAEQHHGLASPHPSPPQPQSTPVATSQQHRRSSTSSLSPQEIHSSTPPPTNAPQDPYATPPKQSLPPSSTTSPPPAAPQKHRSSPTKYQPKPCDVWTCFRPTFCELAPCGCRICREHLGSVIRGAKFVEEEGVAEEASKKGRKKYFVCVACQAKSITSGPVRADSPSPSPSKAGVEPKEESLEQFKITYVQFQPVINATPPTPTPQTSFAEPTEVALTSPQQQQQPPLQQAAIPQLPQPQHQLQPQPQPQQPQYQLPMPPPPAPQAPFLPQGYNDSPPLPHDLPPHQQQSFNFSHLPPRFDTSPPQQRPQPLPQAPLSNIADPSLGLPPAPRTHPDRRARGFSVPQPSSLPHRPRASPPRAATGANATKVEGGAGGGRWTPGASPKSPMRRLQQRSADFAIGSGGGGAGGGGVNGLASASMRWQDPRGPKSDPSEPYQLQKPLWPVIKVENIPFSTTVSDMETWLPKGCLPHEKNVISSIHLILHRATGRTLPHCYLEMASLQIANDVILAMDRKQLGDRTVRIKWERRGELMRDLFSQEGYFALPAPSPAAAPLPPVPTKFVLPQTIITTTDLQQLVSYCERALVPYKERPPERAFLNIVSIIGKFPWAEKELWTETTRDAIFDCAFLAAQIAATNSVADPKTYTSLFNKLRAIVLECIGFTDLQKDLMRSIARENLIIDEPTPHIWSESALGLDLGPSLPPSPPTQRHSRRVSQASLGPDSSLQSSMLLGQPDPFLSHPLPESPPSTPPFPPLSQTQNLPSRRGLPTANTAWAIHLGDVAGANAEHPSA
ncbi:hypothetical protein BCR35DRAFT_334572 [Leucosporidium creatinivorum]|uniref:RRM domain-containing protein n=1 Tax=Leucosporidium creatinivorum TaxID=106004 RepID=A0A1Y2E5M5_9BASI|nr:hypothetical protein BCR35DRAFT_334572 [Leucosporidium creatinivorum]